MVMGVLGPALLGALAFIALPGCYAASQGGLEELGLMGAAALVMAIPLYLLRHSLMPGDVVEWSHALPVSRRDRLKADAACVNLLLLPSIIATGISLSVWLWQLPPWLAPYWRQALIDNAAILAMAYVLGLGLLHARGTPPTSKVRRVRRKGPSRGLTLRRGEQRLWRHLLWLPFIRDSQHTGLKQGLLTGASALAIVLWLLPDSPVPWPRAVTGLLVSGLILLQVTQADKFLRGRLEQVAPLLRSLPISNTKVALYSRLLVAAPALVAVAVFGLTVLRHASYVNTTPSLLYGGCVLLATGGIVFRTKPESHPRIMLVVLSICIQTAIGSEIWK